MDRRLINVAHSRRGTFSTADAGRCGVDPQMVEAAIQRREVVRVRRGAFVLREVWESASREERHVLRLCAILRSRPRDAASHHSALLLAGLPVWDVDLDLATTVGPVSAPIRRSGLRVVPAPCTERLLISGFPALPESVALVQLAASSGVTSAVCSMDAALHAKLCTAQPLTSAINLLPQRHRKRARTALLATDAACESVGESRTRLLLTDLGYAVRSQVSVLDGVRLGARLDFLVEGVVIVEFDGLTKYAGQDGREALAAEKARESRLTAMGFEIVRIIWADLDDPAAIDRRIRIARQVALQRRRAVRG